MRLSILLTALVIGCSQPVKEKQEPIEFKTSAAQDALILKESFESDWKNK